MKARKTYKDEDWLVIITSNHGGEGKNYGGSSNNERNTFTFFYHPKYKSLKLNGEKLNNGSFSAVIKGTVADPTEIYNSKNLGTFTFEARIRLNPFANGTYDAGASFPKILGKGKWNISRQRKEMYFRITNDAGEASQKTLGNVFIDGKWHTVAVVVISESLKWRIKIYMDGALALSEEGAKTNATVVDNEPLTVGGTGVNFNIEEFRIWNKELNAAQIAENACLANILPTHIEYKNLFSYWKMNVAGDVIKNEVSGRPDMTITGPIQYTVSANTLPCNLGTDNIVIENFSILPQIFYWFQIPIESSWALDGTVFLSRFESEFQ